MGKTRVIELSDSKRQHVIVLPINPKEVAITKAQQNQVVNLLSGEANLLGESALDRTTLDSWFPAVKSPFYRYATASPDSYKKIIEDWQHSKTPVRLIISDINYNKAMTIDSFVVKKIEGDADLHYSLTLTEYRELNVPSVKVDTRVKASIKRRPAPTSPASSSGSSSSGNGGSDYTVKSGDTLWAIATKYYGNGASYGKIYDANKDIIESTARSRGFASAEGGKWIFPGEGLKIP